MSLRRLPAGAIISASSSKTSKQVGAASRRHGRRQYVRHQHGGGGGANVTSKGTSTTSNASMSAAVSVAASSSLSMSSPSSVETFDGSGDDDDDVEYFGDVDLYEFVRTIPSMTSCSSSSASTLTSTATSRRHQGSNSYIPNSSSTRGMTKQRGGGKKASSGSSDFGTTTWSRKTMVSVFFLVVGSSLVLLRDKFFVSRSLIEIKESNLSSSFLRKSDMEVPTKKTSSPSSSSSSSSSSGTMTAISIGIATDDPQEKNEGGQAANAQVEKQEDEQQQETTTTTMVMTTTTTEMTEPSTTSTSPSPTTATATTTTTKRPYLLLHVGPQKTGSSTLQSAWDIMSTSLEEHDNYHVEHITPEHGHFECDVGPWGGFRDCKAGKILRDTVATVHSKGQNLILSDENLDQRFVGPLRDLIDESMWNVKVVVVYRRIHEWLVSWVSFRNRHRIVFVHFGVVVHWPLFPYVGGYSLNLLNHKFLSPLN